MRTGGWAHVEEIRQALKVWREAHRIHHEPNLKHEQIIIRPNHGKSKPSYAFAVRTNIRTTVLKKLAKWEQF